MINKLKNNTKIKLISFLSAIALWMYVMAVVDPEETRLIEDVPITISNMEELRAANLVIYPETELTTDIRITGKLSNIQNVKKERIHISGNISDPIEGNNKVYLKANISERVTHEFKNDVEVVNLEKKIEEPRNVEVKVEGKLKNNIQIVKLSNETIDVSGPRSLVKQVKGVVGVINSDNKTGDFTQKVSLTPIDKNGEVVENIEMNQKNINVEGTVLMEKDVPIKINFNDSEQISENLDDYEISKTTIGIRGKKEKLEDLEYIQTHSIKISDISDSKPAQVELILPDGVFTDDKYITIKLKTKKKNSIEFDYQSNEIELRNKPSDAEDVSIKDPANVKVKVESYEDLSKLTKGDIILYIDMGNSSSENDEYELKYETNQTFDQIKIEPTVVEVK